MTLSCNASGDPIPTISWTKDGSIMNASGDSRISFGADNKELTITNVSRADKGEYRCLANNDPGKATSNPAFLNVQCKFDLLYIGPMMMMMMMTMMMMMMMMMMIMRRRRRRRRGGGRRRRTRSMQITFC